ncbi:hypothetical protein LC608_35595 [Nostoc sp. XA010]|nr:hypothetical protein [Nostoc sp. XA010]MCC5662142.1 hypothetical protein [Nostoc sp. XA010]
MVYKKGQYSSDKHSSPLLFFLKRLDTEITLHLRLRHAGKNQAAETVVSL